MKTNELQQVGNLHSQGPKDRRKTRTHIIITLRNITIDSQKKRWDFKPFWRKPVYTRIEQHRNCKIYSIQYEIVKDISLNAHHNGIDCLAPSAHSYSYLLPDPKDKHNNSGEILRYVNIEIL